MSRRWPLISALLLLMPGIAGRGSAGPPNFQYMIPRGAQVGSTVDLDVHAFDDWPVKAWVDRPGLTVQINGKKNEATAIVSSDAVPGVYLLRFYDAQGTTPLIPFVMGHLPEVTEQEKNNVARKPLSLTSLPVVVNGRIERDDVDVFAVSLAKGQTLVASIESHRTLASPMDGVLEILSEQGFVLAHNDDDQGLDPRIAFIAPEAGTYLVRVFGFPATPDSTIGLAGGRNYVYRLTLATEAFVDYALPMAVTSPADRVAVQGWNISPEVAELVPAPLTDPALALLTHPRLANALVIPVVSHKSMLAVEPSRPDQPQRVELPVTVTGRIERPRDKDLFEFSAEAGQVLQLRVESRALGYPLDPVLELFDSQGKSLGRVDDAGDNRDAELVLAAPADGTYRVAVSDLHRQGGPRFVYRLTAKLAEPDFSLSVDGDAFSVAAGAKLELPVTVERLHGFAQPIAIAVSGLPEGTTAEPVTSPAEGEAAKGVKLVISAGSAPFSGSIRVSGSTNGQYPLAHDATAALAGSPRRTNHLWLTVTEPAKK